MKKNVLIAGGSVLVLLILIFAFSGGETADGSEIVVDVEKGEFIVDIVTTGELEAKNSVNILGPSQLRNYRIYNVNIQDIIEEGKVVKKGDYVAQLDPSELSNRIQDAQLELESRKSQYEQTHLDTALQMRQARNELINLEYAVEEKSIVLEQSKFEPPATVKQAEIELDKARRAFQQAKENYEIKYRQNVAKMRQASNSLKKQQNDFDGMLELRESFIIKAPEDGMLIYRKSWNGTQIKEGSQISAWDPIVATLPDLSVMMSKTYVNEVDVRKVKPGQSVDIGLDAFPEKKFKGEVISVANVGEQRPNSDAKVFQVNIELKGTDDLLRPSMTTSNVINITTLKDVLHIPLEALHNAYDSITFVYKKEGISISKQEVIVGLTNNNEAVIEKGLEVNDRVYLSVPGGVSDANFVLLPELEGKRNLEKKESEEIMPEESGGGNNRMRRQGGRSAGK
jgi:HlyD family secretion protein